MLGSRVRAPEGVRSENRKVLAFFIAVGACMFRAPHAFAMRTRTCTGPFPATDCTDPDVPKIRIRTKRSPVVRKASVSSGPHSCDPLDDRLPANRSSSPERTAETVRPTRSRSISQKSPAPRQSAYVRPLSKGLHPGFGTVCARNIRRRIRPRNLRTKKERPRTVPPLF